MLCCGVAWCCVVQYNDMKCCVVFIFSPYLRLLFRLHFHFHSHIFFLLIFILTLVLTPIFFSLPIFSISLVSCIINVTASSPQVENTVFIVIQKLFASTQATGGLKDGPGTWILLDILSTSSSSSSSSSFSSPSYTSTITNKTTVNSNNDNRGRITTSTATTVNTLRTKYLPATVGCLLSGHLLLRGFPHPVGVTDNRAVLTWLGRAFLNFHDISIAYALDIFMCCLKQSEENYCDKRSKRNDSHREGNNNYNNNNNNNNNSNNNNNRSGYRTENSNREKTSTSQLQIQHQVQVEHEEKNFLLVTAESCMARIFRMKGLVLTGDTVQNTIIPDMPQLFFAVVSVGSGMSSSVRARNMSDTQGGGVGAGGGGGVVWNVLSVSTNLIRMTGSERSGRSERAHTEVKDSEDITATVYAAFWVLQRSAALHASLCRTRRKSLEHSNRGSVYSSGGGGSGRCTVRSAHPMSMYDTSLSVRILLSLSELDIPDKIPWMARTDSAAAVLTETGTGVGGGTGTGLADTAMSHMRNANDGERNTTSSSSSNSNNNNNRSTRSTTAATHRTTPSPLDSTQYHPLSDSLCVWACGAGDGIEGIAFLRSQSMSAATAIRSFTTCNTLVEFTLF
jgi:hypothetical protein